MNCYYRKIYSKRIASRFLADMNPFLDEKNKASKP